MIRTAFSGLWVSFRRSIRSFWFGGRLKRCRRIVLGSWWLCFPAKCPAGDYQPICGGCGWAAVFWMRLASGGWSRWRRSVRPLPCPWSSAFCTSRPLHFGIHWFQPPIGSLWGSGPTRTDHPRLTRKMGTPCGRSWPGGAFWVGGIPLDRKCKFPRRSSWSFGPSYDFCWIYAWLPSVSSGWTTTMPSRWQRMKAWRSFWTNQPVKRVSWASFPVPKTWFVRRVLPSQNGTFWTVKPSWVSWPFHSHRTFRIVCWIFCPELRLLWREKDCVAWAEWILDLCPHSWTFDRGHWNDAQVQDSFSECW